MKPDACPALSDRTRTFATIANAAAGLGIPAEAVRLAKHLGCTAFRPNGSVHEGELVRWLLTSCWQFWSEPLEGLDAELFQFPEDAHRWLESAPVGQEAATVREGAFQWLRLVHGDTVAAKVKADAERALSDLAAAIPSCILDGSANFSRADELRELGISTFQPAKFPAVIPVWRLDASPFAIIGANELWFWQWSEEGVREWCADGEVPKPPPFLVVPDYAAKRMPRLPKNCYGLPGAGSWSPSPDLRSLLDFVPSRPAKSRQTAAK